MTVLVLTARNQTQQCVEALNVGADDYLTKPFDLSILIARIHALTRRNRGYSSNTIQIGELQIHPDTQQAYYQGQLLTLSRREYSLLESFMLYPNQILKNEDLIDKVYGFQESIESNAINVHIYHLRQKNSPRYYSNNSWCGLYAKSSRVKEMKSYSLKWRLVTTISSVFILLWSLVFYWLYVDLEKRLQSTLDQRLSASAQMVAHLIQQLPVNEIIDTLNSAQQKHDSQNLLVCEVSFLNSGSGTDPQVIVRTQGSPKLSTRHVGFSTWHENNIEWRSYVLQKGHIQVVTAEKLQLRYSLLKQILQSVLIPLILTLILCILLILWIVRVEFQPLDQIAQRVKQRQQHFSTATTELLELKAQNIPQEIQPFVDSLVELVQNLHQSLENEKSFSAFAAHELRSPLTAIKTHVQLSKLMLAQAQIEVQPNQLYSVQWQGCADDGLCYPVQRTTIQTDATGLLPQQKLGSAQTKLALLVQEPEKTTDTSEQLNHQDLNTAQSESTQAEAIKPSEDTQQTNDSTDTANIQQDSVTQSATAAAESSDQQQVASKTFKQAWNNDQFFLSLLSNQTVWFNLIAFLGFGILLAFLPCSLPLIPILSSILVQQNKRRKAALIALTFVTSMALVYAVMGFVVSQIGFNVQRWFQNPMVIGLFVLMFIAFALNLFGLYQLSLPQSVLQRLDRIQQGQKGGTLFSAAIMGALSALIVGPCMSAPLAGALLYVSQLEHGMLGGLYLFLMGLGIGIPIFIASVFGAKYLPKPGLWMERL